MTGTFTRSVNGRTVTLLPEERQVCEVWSRVMGYFRPVSDWNKGKQSEFRERVYFKQPEL